MASAMLLKFQKYWDDVHVMMGVAAVFDPRYKMKLVEFFLPQIYSEDASTKIQEIRSHCYDLFHEYKSSFSGGFHLKHLVLVKSLILLKLIDYRGLIDLLLLVELLRRQDPS